MKKKLIIILNNENFGNMLGELEDIMNRQGRSFQARAYKKAQETIMEMNEELLNVKQLENKPGIGKSIIDKYKE
jgi:DNA polymerase/3'-5' exonuclease PolX